MQEVIEETHLDQWLKRGIWIKDLEHWRAVCERYINHHHISAYLQLIPSLEAPRKYVPSSVDWPELAETSFHRSSIGDCRLRRIETYLPKFSVVKVSGDVLLLYLPKLFMLVMRTFKKGLGRDVRECFQESVKLIELARVKRGLVRVESETELEEPLAYHDYLFVLTDNGLINLLDMTNLETVNVLTMYHGLELSSICYDSELLYVYDGHYAVSVFSVPDLQRQERISVDLLSSFHVSNGTLAYISGSGKYQIPEEEVGITPLCDGNPLELSGSYNSKIFHLDCILISDLLDNFLTVDGENYRSLVLKEIPGKVTCVAVSGPTLALGLETGMVLLYHVRKNDLLHCNLDEPMLSFPVLNGKAIWFLELFDTHEGFGFFASDGAQASTFMFFRRDGESSFTF